MHDDTSTERPVRSARSRTARAVGLGAALAGAAMFGGAGAALAATSFSDVPASSTFHDDIIWAADNGIASGYPDGTYRPSSPVSRGSMAAFLHRLAATDPAVAPTVNAHSLRGYSPEDFGLTVHAVVESDGVLDRGSHVFGSSRIGTGSFEVLFTRQVSTCAYQATIGSTSDGITNGFATVSTRSGNSFGVHVSTYDASGNSVSLPFHLTVHC